MAIEVDATLIPTNPSGFSFTVGSGEDRLLVVAISHDDYGQSPDSITYGSASLTKYVDENNGIYQYVELWYLVAPLSGTANITLNGYFNGYRRIGVVSFTGVNQVNPLRGSASGTGNSNNPSLTIASAANDLVLDALCMRHYGESGDPSFTPGTGQEELIDTGDSRTCLGVSIKAGAPSVTTSWTWLNVGDAYAMVSISIQPSAAASSSGPSLAFRQAAYASETGRAVIALITIDHDDLTEPIRISTDPTQRLDAYTTDAEVVYGTISRSNTFIFLPVTLKLPSDTDEGPGQMTVEIDNVHRQYTETIRSIFTPATFSVELVMDNALDTVEAEWPDFLLTNIKYDATTITGTLSLELLDTEPFPAGSFSPAYFPGLF